MHPADVFKQLELYLLIMSDCLPMAVKTVCVCVRARARACVRVCVCVYTVGQSFLCLVFVSPVILPLHRQYTSVAAHLRRQ